MAGAFRLRESVCALILDQEGTIVLELVRGAGSADPVHAFFNLGGQTHPLSPLVDRGGTLLFSSEAVAYSGARDQMDHIGEILPYECVVFGPASCRAFP